MDGSWEFILKSYVEKTIRVFEDEEIKTILWGSCFWLENGSINTNILDIAHAAINNLLDYNELFGYYKIVIHSKVSGDYFFWGDNSGTQGFFVDEQNCVFSNSFLTIKERAASVQPNYYAIAQLFSAGYILSNDTVVAGIVSTDWRKTYSCINGNLEIKNKGLVSLSNNKGMDLHTLILGLRKAFLGEIAAVCTGGTDSRS